VEPRARHDTVWFIGGSIAPGLWESGFVGCGLKAANFLAMLSGEYLFSILPIPLIRNPELK